MSRASLLVSSCGRFAIVVNSTGAPFLVYSKKYANHMVKEGVRFGVITREDAKRLRQEIHESPLPNNDREVGAAVKVVIMRCNEDITSAPAGTGVVISGEAIKQAIDVAEARMRAQKN